MVLSHNLILSSHNMLRLLLFNSTGFVWQHLLVCYDSLLWIWIGSRSCMGNYMKWVTMHIFSLILVLIIDLDEDQACMYIFTIWLHAWFYMLHHATCFCITCLVYVLTSTFNTGHLYSRTLNICAIKVHLIYMYYLSGLILRIRSPKL